MSDGDDGDRDPPRSGDGEGASASPLSDEDHGASRTSNDDATASSDDDGTSSQHQQQQHSHDRTEDDDGEESEASPQPASPESRQLPSFASSSSPGSTTGRRPKHVTVAEPPRWRFVRSAKKSLGYSSTAAGTAVEGLSAAELAARASQDWDSMDGDLLRRRAREMLDLAFPRPSGSSDSIDEVAPPATAARRASRVLSFVQEKEAREEQQQRRHRERQQRRFEQQLNELENETQQMKLTLERLCGEILEAEREREALEARRTREEEERTSRERARREASAAAARWLSRRLPIAEKAPPEGPVDMEIDRNAATVKKFGGKRRRCGSWARYAATVALTVVVVALLGVVLGSEGSNSGHILPPDNLRGTDNVEGEEVGLKGPPPLPARAPVPLVPSSLPATASPVVPPSSSSPSLLPTWPATMLPSSSSPAALVPAEFITCPEGTVQFELTLRPLGGGGPRRHPAVDWSIVDSCTLERLHHCHHCDPVADEALAVGPASYAGCLPRGGGGGGGEYVLQLTLDPSSPGLSGFEYVLKYGNQIVLEAAYENRGDSSEDDSEGDGGGPFRDRLRLHHFGEGGGCSERPSLSPSALRSDSPSFSRHPSYVPTPVPTQTPSISFKPSAAPTRGISIKGCWGFSYPGKNIPHTVCTNRDPYGRCWVKGSNICCCDRNGPPGWTPPEDW